MGSSATRRGLEWQTTGSGEGLGAVLVVKVGGGAPIYVDGEEMETSAESLSETSTLQEVLSTAYPQEGSGRRTDTTTATRIYIPRAAHLSQIHRG